MRKLSAKLFDNVQFIYELALAQAELGALGAEFKPTNGLREFELTKITDEEKLVKRTAYFEKIDGKKTDYAEIIKHNQTRSVNQYLTHWIYPYKGKFHPQMIRALLNYIQLDSGDTLLDPFVGSGTAAVEAQLLGIECIGVDISPLCVVQSRVKTESLHALSKIKELRDEVINSIKSRNALLNYGPTSTSSSFSKTIDDISDENARNFYKLAELLAYSDEARRNRSFSASLAKNIDLMITSVEDYVQVVKKLGLRLGEVKITRGDCRKLELDDESIDGIITSPPYSIALDYVKQDAHALKALGNDLEKVREQFIGVRGTNDERIVLYNQDMKKAYSEMYRVLKQGKYCAIIIGNATYHGEEVKTVEFTIDCCKKIGFELVKNVDKIIYGLYNVMQKENILIFRK